MAIRKHPDRKYCFYPLISVNTSNTEVSTNVPRPAHALRRKVLKDVGAFWEAGLSIPRIPRYRQMCLAPLMR